MLPKVYTKSLLILSFLFLIVGCTQTTEWKYDDTIPLNGNINPLGITGAEGIIWISAPRQKQLTGLDKNGNIIKRFRNLQRPMRIHSDKGKLYIPIYLEDQVHVLKRDSLTNFELKIQPDAPAAVFVKGDTVAVADFYNHRIILQTGDQVTTIGEKGHGKGQLFYPTDLEITDHLIFIADAYNHRVQVFDRHGKPLKIIGTHDDINVATGISVYNEQLFVADFFNNRVLVYDFDGNRIQTLSKYFNQPADIKAVDGALYIPNYGDTALVRYVRK